MTDATAAEKTRGRTALANDKAMIANTIREILEEGRTKFSFYMKKRLVNETEYFCFEERKIVEGRKGRKDKVLMPTAKGKQLYGAYKGAMTRKAKADAEKTDETSLIETMTETQAIGGIVPSEPVSEAPAESDGEQKVETAEAESTPEVAKTGDKRKMSLSQLREQETLGEMQNAAEEATAE